MRNIKTTFSSILFFTFLFSFNGTLLTEFIRCSTFDHIFKRTSIRFLNTTLHFYSKFENENHPTPPKNPRQNAKYYSRKTKFKNGDLKGIPCN